MCFLSSFQLQHRLMARVVVFHSTVVIYPIYGGRNVDLTPWMISRGKICGMVFLKMNSFEKCLLRQFLGAAASSRLLVNYFSHAHARAVSPLSLEM